MNLEQESNLINHDLYRKIKLEFEKLNVMIYVDFTFKDTVDVITRILENVESRLDTR